jgi:hypothetical protein
LPKSRYILVTAIARAVPAGPNLLPYLSEPVVGTITLQTEISGLQLLALAADGRVVERLNPQTSAEAVRFDVPTRRGTHWYALKAADPPAQSGAKHTNTEPVASD